MDHPFNNPVVKFLAKRKEDKYCHFEKWVACELGCLHIDICLELGNILDQIKDPPKRTSKSCELCGKRCACRSTAELEEMRVAYEYLKDDVQCAMDSLCKEYSIKTFPTTFFSAKGMISRSKDMNSRVRKNGIKKRGVLKTKFKSS